MSDATRETEALHALLCDEYERGRADVLAQLSYAADLVREYIETGGEAHEVIRAHRAISSLLGQAAGA